VVEIGLPGGVNAEATALVDIGVVPERRGRGLARALVTAALNQAQSRGEALAVLNTDILGLYERFGFGVATTAWSATLSLSGALDRRDGDAVHLIGAAVAARLLPEIFAESHRHRVGEVLRTPAWWDEHLADAALARVPTEFAVLERDGDREGYVAFVRPAQQSGSTLVAELIVHDDEHAAELLDFVREVIGGGQVRLRSQPFDVIAALDGTATERESSPQLWLRVLDVARALSLRRYAASSSTVLSISDELLEVNRGRFLLETANDGTAAVARTAEAPAIALDVGALARVFLGGSTFAELAAAKEIVVSDDSALASLDRAFAPARAPFCSTLL
jgi:predicted acetyltransferase